MDERAALVDAQLQAAVLVAGLHLLLVGVLAEVALGDEVGGGEGVLGVAGLGGLHFVEVLFGEEAAVGQQRLVHGA